MITTILSDFSRVILNPKDKNYKGPLNGLYKKLIEQNKLFNFFDYFEFNNGVLNLYTQLRSKYPIYIFTTGIIQNAPEVRERIKSIFDDVFSAEENGLDKEKSDAYIFVAQKLKKNTNEILYIDDEQKNIDAAKKTGLRTIRFEEYKKLFYEIKQTLT